MTSRAAEPGTSCEGMPCTTIRIDYPTHVLHGRTFENARLEVLEVGLRDTIQDRYRAERWKARATDRFGVAEIDCYVVATPDGPIGVPAAVCVVLHAAA